MSKNVKSGKSKGYAKEKSSDYTDEKMSAKEGYKGRKGARKGESNFPRDGRNDPAWYAKNNALVSGAGTLSFNQPLGSTIRDTYDGVVFAPPATGLKDIFYPNRKGSTPGVFCLDFIPTVGYGARDTTSNVTVAARNIYSYVRHANSGHTNYEAPDLMFYLLSMDSLYMLWMWCTRLYGLLRTFSNQNRYIPEGIFTAMHVNYHSFLTQMADFRYFINYMAVKLSSFNVPSTMKYFTRHSWMCQNVYADSPNTSKAQYYLFCPEYLWKYNEYTTPGQLDPAPFVNRASDGTITPVTLAWLQNKFEGLIQPIAESEDIAIMSGDILKAYGTSGLWNLPQVESTYTIVPIYNEQVLDQIHNCTTVGEPFAYTTVAGGMPTFDYAHYNNNHVIRQFVNPATNGGNIYFSPSFINRVYGPTNHILGMDSPEPSAIDVLEATRLTPGSISALVHYNKNLGKLEYTEVFPQSFGAELVCRFRYVGFMNDTYPKETSGATYIAWLKGDNDRVMHDVPLYTAQKMIPTDDDAHIHYLIPQVLAEAEKFHKHPRLMYYSSKSGTALDSNASVAFVKLTDSFELTNYSMTDPTVIDRMHDTAMLSLFDIPAVGATN